VTTTGVSPLANQWYRFKVLLENQADRTNIKAKIWLESEAEPLDWQVDAFDAAANRLTSGTVGMWSMGSGTKYWDDFGADLPGVEGEYAESGQALSSVFDTQIIEDMDWEALTSNSTIPGSTDIDFEVRASDQAFNQVSQTPNWQAPDQLPSGRYMQWKASLSTVDLTVSPTLHDITATYEGVICEDGDGDGFAYDLCGGEDCNDQDIDSNPDALEICGNSTDENCDEVVEDCVACDGSNYYNGYCCEEGWQGSYCQGEPPTGALVSSVSGEVNHGGSITVFGSGFESEGPEIIMWDDFESGTLGDYLVGNPPAITHSGILYSMFNFEPENGQVIVYDDEYSRYGNKAAKLSWTDNEDTGFGCIGCGPFQQLYMSWQRRHRPITNGEIVYNPPAFENHKMFRTWANADPSGRCMEHYASVGGESYWRLTTQAEGIGYETRSWPTPGANFAGTVDTWQRWEYHIKTNNPGVANGILKMWINNSTQEPRCFYSTDFGEEIPCEDLEMTACDGGETGFATRVIIGQMTRYHLFDEVNAWFDDLYVATSPARIEIGNASTWAECTDKNVQPHLTWNENVIEVQVNTGAFQQGQTAYLYMIDSAGNVSNSGIGVEVTIGQDIVD